MLRMLYINFQREMLGHLILGAFLAATPLMMTYLSYALLMHMQTSSLSGSYLIAIICLTLALATIQYFFQIKSKNLNLKALGHLLPIVWSNMLRHDHLQDDQSAVVMQKITNYEFAISTLVSAVMSILINVLSLCCLLFYLAYCHSYFALLLFCMTLMMLLMKHVHAKSAQTIMHKILSAQNAIAQFSQESLLQITKIRSANAESRIYQQWLHKLISVKQPQEKNHQINLKVSTWEKALPIALMFCLYFILYFYPDRIDTMTLLTFIICLSQFAGLYDKLSSDLIAVYQSLPALNSMKQLVTAHPEQIEQKNQIAYKIRGDIVIDQVSLRAKDSQQWLLKDICINIKAGEFVGIIGESGAGKSTLLKLLLGIATPDSGDIKIDGSPLSAYDIQSLRKQFGVVMQTSPLLPGTIWSNIAMFADISLDETWLLAQQVGLAKDIEAMPMRMHTYISDTAGESISGGQKQKILLARALASKPRVLILDEATSALDNISQQVIFGTLNQMQITRIVIAHRQSTLIGADSIYLMNKGRLKFFNADKT